MPVTDPRILALNPGSTSTKFGIFAAGELTRVWTIRHSDLDLAPFQGKPVSAQQDFRLRLIREALAAEGVSLDSFDAFVGRGGLLRPMKSGTYEVNAVLLEEARRGPYGQHASNLGAVLAERLASLVHSRAFIVDPVSVNERSPLARISGLPVFETGQFNHALNSKAVAKRHAREQKQDYDSTRLIVAHLGGGICISAHADGLMFDATDASSTGPFSPDRAGTLPALPLVRFCFSGDHSQQEIERMLTGEGGLFAYLGTKDLLEVEERIQAGDEKAQLVFQAMVYQIAKEIGSMAAALAGKVDAILLTGGMAYSEMLVEAITRRVDWIAPVRLFPGEEELTALAEGVVRVLSGEEEARLLPEEVI